MSTEDFYLSFPSLGTCFGYFVFAHLFESVPLFFNLLNVNEQMEEETSTKTEENAESSMDSSKTDLCKNYLN